MIESAGKWTPDQNEPQDAPSTESQKSNDEPIINTEQENITKKRADKLFWMRVVFAIIGGIAATFLFEGIEDSEEHRWTSITIYDRSFPCHLLHSKANED